MDVMSTWFNAFDVVNPKGMSLPLHDALTVVPCKGMLKFFKTNFIDHDLLPTPRHGGHYSSNVGLSYLLPSLSRRATSPPARTLIFSSSSSPILPSHFAEPFPFFFFMKCSSATLHSCAMFHSWRRRIGRDEKIQGENRGWGEYKPHQKIKKHHDSYKDGNSRCLLCHISLTQATRRRALASIFI